MNTNPASPVYQDEFEESLYQVYLVALFPLISIITLSVICEMVTSPLGIDLSFRSELLVVSLMTTPVALFYLGYRLFIYTIKDHELALPKDISANYDHLNEQQAQHLKTESERYTWLSFSALCWSWMVIVICHVYL